MRDMLHSVPDVAQNKHQIQSLLAQANTEPRKRFGQNFMIDQNLVRVVADAGQIAAGDWVIEVGPGTGTLTEELLSQGRPGDCGGDRPGSGRHAAGEIRRGCEI